MSGIRQIMEGLEPGTDNLQALSLLRLTENWSDRDLEQIYQTMKDRLVERNERIVAINCSKFDWTIKTKNNIEKLKEIIIEIMTFMEDFIEFDNSYLENIKTDMEWFRVFYDLPVFFDENYSFNQLKEWVNKWIEHHVFSEKIATMVSMTFNKIFSGPLTNEKSKQIINFLSLNTVYKKYFILLKCHKYDYVIIYCDQYKKYDSFQIINNLNELNYYPEAQLFCIYQVD